MEEVSKVSYRKSPAAGRKKGGRNYNKHYTPAFKLKIVKLYVGSKGQKAIDFNFLFAPNRTAQHTFISIHVQRREACSLIAGGWTRDVWMGDHCCCANGLQISNDLIKSL